ncbi:MAG TPA: DUF2630 family protein [Kineosporiaceae bacterium]|nr:DUF2630 family protein [Kineosporiaceae bacterium]
MEDREILDCIRGLVAEEHWLRQERDRGALSEDVEIRRLSEVERSLDQLWDLLRRRRAMRAAGLNPDVAEERPSLQLDAYLQ